MKLVQTVVEKDFFVEHGGKLYYVNYLASDGHSLGLLNRDEWEITCEDHESLGIYEFSEINKKEKAEVRKNQILADKLIDFCIKH
jgi:hypothetical protein